MALALLFPSSAGAHPQSHCTSRQFRTVATRSYTPWNQPRSERKRLKRLKHCASNDKMRRQMRRIEDALQAERRAAIRAYRRQWGRCRHDAPAGSQSIRDCIRGGAIEYGQDYGWLLSVATCESELNRYAYNPSGATGLFQFMPSTWATTPFGSKSIYSARWQSLAAAWMFANGRSGEWVCQ